MEDNKSDSPTKSLLEMGEAKNISPTKSLSELEDDLDNPMNEEARQKATLADLDQTYESDKSQEHKPPVRRFGVQMGLFSKFTNAPTLDEFTLAKILGQIVDSPDKLDIIKEEASLKKQTTSKEDQSPPQRLQSLWSFQGSEYEAPDVGDLEDQKHEYLGWYKFSIASVIFATQFAGALEIVYISPLFSRMELPPLLDATVWVFPVMFITIVTPFVNIFASHLLYERTAHFIIMILSLMGCFVFAFLNQFLPLITVVPEEVRLWTIYLGFTAFILLDTSNEMTTLIQNKMIHADSELDTRFNNFVSRLASFAKALAYLLGSLQAFGMNFEHGIIPSNLDLSFIFAGILLFVSLNLTILYQIGPTRGYKGPVTRKFKQLKVIHFLPPPNKVIKSSPKLKLVLLSHFLGAGGVLMLTVYATLWVGGNVFEGDVTAAAGSDEYVQFKYGLSWGSFCLFLSTIFSGVIKHLMYRSTKAENFDRNWIKSLYISSLVIGGVAVIVCARFSHITLSFIMLCFTGFAFETFHVIPGMLADILEVQELGQHYGKYRHLLGFSLFYAQVFMFFLVPLGFLMFPDRDDTTWGMLAAGSSMLASGIIGWFI